MPFQKVVTNCFVFLITVISCVSSPTRQWKSVFDAQWNLKMHGEQKSQNLLLFLFFFGFQTNLAPIFPNLLIMDNKLVALFPITHSPFSLHQPVYPSDSPSPEAVHRNAVHSWVRPFFRDPSLILDPPRVDLTSPVCRLIRWWGRLLTYSSLSFFFSVSFFVSVSLIKNENG